MEAEPGNRRKGERDYFVGKLFITTILYTTIYTAERVDIAGEAGGSCYAAAVRMEMV